MAFPIKVGLALLCDSFELNILVYLSCSLSPILSESVYFELAPSILALTVLVFYLGLTVLDLANASAPALSTVVVSALKVANRENLALPPESLPILVFNSSTTS